MPSEPAELPRALVGAAWVATRLGLHRSSVKRAAADGRIPAYRILSDWRFDPDEIEAWLAERHNRPPTERQAHVAPLRCGTGARRPAMPAHADPSPRVVIYPDAPWRGINDVPEEPVLTRPTKQAKERKKSGT
jgi:excisionase family DNA binding protein